MKNILVILKKEVIQLRRNPLMLRMLIFAPLVQLILFAYAISLDLKNTPIVVYDQDNSSLSRQLVDEMTNSDYFLVVDYATKMEGIDYNIESGEAMLGLMIPPDFSRNIYSNKTAQISSVVDGSDSNNATIAMGYMASIIERRMIKLFEENLGVDLETSLPRVTPEIRVWYNPELRSRVFMIPAVIAMIMMVMTLALNSMAVVREKEMGTIEQLIVSPIKPYQLILGKILPYVFVGYIDITLIIVVGKYLFDVPTEGSIPLLYFLSFFFLLTTLGLGIFASTISRNQQQAILTSLFLMMSNVVLSGFVFPISSMPEPIQALTYAIPLRYFLVIIRSILLKDAGLDVLWDESLMLAAFGIFIITLSILRFKKQLV